MSFKLISNIATNIGEINCLVILNNQSFASGSSDTTVKIWNSNTNELISTLIGHKGPINALIVLKNGWLASASSDATIKIWNTLLVEIYTLTHIYSVSSLALLNDGSLLSASSDGLIIIWDQYSFRVKSYLDGDFGGNFALTVLNNGSFISAEKCIN